MKKKIVLSTVVDALYHVSTNNHVFINLESGDIISVDDSMSSDDREEIFFL